MATIDACLDLGSVRIQELQGAHGLVTQYAERWHRHVSTISVYFDSCDMSLMLRLVFVFILSRIDYCNPVLAGLTAAALAPLQRECCG